MKKFASFVLSPWSKRSAAIGATLLVLATMLVACGDDDSSDFATRPSGDSSSSDVILSGDSHEESSESKSSSSKKGDAGTESGMTSSSGKYSSSASLSSSSSAKSSSSSKVKSSSSSSVFEGYVDPLTVVKGTMTDERDGQTYKTVKIGTQTWMAENLNYAFTGVPYNNDGVTSDSTSWCYDNDPANCAKYGRLYTWAAAMDSVGTWSANGKGCGYGSTCSPTGTVRGVCPEGWHLPTRTEWYTLFTAVGGSSTAGKMLKSTSGWNSSGNGTDAYSFAALPVGYYNDGNYYNEGYHAYFWSSTEYNRNFAYNMGSYYNYDATDFNYVYLGFSVRCAKD